MDRKVYQDAFHLNDTELNLIGELVPPGQMLIRKAQSSKKVHLNVDSVSHWIGHEQPTRQHPQAGILQALWHSGKA